MTPPANCGESSIRLSHATFLNHHYRTPRITTPVNRYKRTSFRNLPVTHSLPTTRSCSSSASSTIVRMASDRDVLPDA